jgi:undecaprenyl-diphosphatase
VNQSRLASSRADHAIMSTASAWLARIGHHELGLLISLATFAGGVWLFVVLTGEVLEGDTHAFDQWLLLAMRNSADLSDPVGPLWFEELARDVTALGGVGLLTFLTLAIAGFLWLDGKGRSALFLVVAIAGGLAASMSLKAGFDRPRPELVPHGSHVYTSSFPSGHSMMSAIVYLTLGALLARFQRSRRLKAYVLGLAALITLCVGASRVYLGVHWPTDVLAGWTAGAAWALACWMIARHLQRSGTVEEES